MRCSILISLSVIVWIVCLTSLSGNPGQRRAAPPPGALVLFDGNDFSQWTHKDGSPVQWVIRDGYMETVNGTGDIISKRKFEDFRLHLEFTVSQNGNSGVYLQQRYEIQIFNSFGVASPTNSDCGAIWGYRPPAVNASLAPLEWQTYDIVFRAARWDESDPTPVKIENARVTVRHNSVLIHDDVEITRATQGEDPEAPTPESVLLQDLCPSGSFVRFRAIWVEESRASAKHWKLYQ